MGMTPLRMRLKILIVFRTRCWINSHESNSRPKAYIMWHIVQITLRYFLPYVPQKLQKKVFLIRSMLQPRSESRALETLAWHPRPHDYPAKSSQRLEITCKLVFVVLISRFPLQSSNIFLLKKNEFRKVNKMGEDFKSAWSVTKAIFQMVLLWFVLYNKKNVNI